MSTQPVDASQVSAAGLPPVKSPDNKPQLTIVLPDSPTAKTAIEAISDLAPVLKATLVPAPVAGETPPLAENVTVSKVITPIFNAHTTSGLLDSNPGLYPVLSPTAPKTAPEVPLALAPASEAAAPTPVQPAMPTAVEAVAATVTTVTAPVITTTEASSAPSDVSGVALVNEEEPTGCTCKDWLKWTVGVITGTAAAALIVDGSMEVASALGYSGEAAILVAIIGVAAVVFTGGIIFMAAKTIINMLAARKIEPIESEADSEANTPTAGSAASTAEQVQQVARPVVEKPILALLKAKAAEVVARVIKLETTLKSHSSFDLGNTQLEELDKQLKQLRVTFAECAVTVGFTDALNIVEAEIAQVKKSIALSKANDAGINVRELILFGKKDITKVTNPTNIRNLMEIGQGILTDIQSVANSFIAKRFIELAQTNIKDAIKRANKDVNRFNEHIPKKAEFAGLEIDPKKIVDAIRRKTSTSANFKKLVNGLVQKLIAKRTAEGLTNKEALASIRADADELQPALKNGDTALFIETVNNEYKAEVKKIIQAQIRDELPELEAICLDQLDQLIREYTKIRDQKKDLVASNNWSETIAKAAIEAFEESTEAVVQVATKQGVKQARAEALRIIEVAKERIAVLDEAYVTVDDKMNEIVKIAKSNGVKLSDDYDRFVENYNAKWDQIDAIKEEIKQVEGAIVFAPNENVVPTSPTKSVFDISREIVVKDSPKAEPAAAKTAPSSQAPATAPGAEPAAAKTAPGSQAPATAPGKGFLRSFYDKLPKGKGTPKPAAPTVAAAPAAILAAPTVTAAPAAIPPAPADVAAKPKVSPRAPTLSGVVLMDEVD